MASGTFKAAVVKKIFNLFQDISEGEMITAKPTYEALEQRVSELEQRVSECQQAEASLRESQNVLRAAIENLPFDFLPLMKTVAISSKIPFVLSTGAI
jgi:cell division septum initiation protein DivIVA